MTTDSRQHKTTIGSSFDPKAASSYYICIQIGQTNIKSVILDVLEKQFVATEQIRIEGTALSLEQAIQHWKKTTKFSFFEKCQILFSYYCKPFTLVPRSIFDEKLLSEYLTFNGKLDSNAFTSFRYLPNLEAYLVYNSDLEKEKYIKNQLPNTQVTHVYAGFLTGSGIDVKSEHQNLIQLNLSDNVLTLIVFKNRKLIFFNDFEVSSLEDILYYVVFSLEQLDIVPNQESVKVSGDINLYPNLVKQLAIYINDVSIADNPVSFQFENALGSQDTSMFYSLFCSYLCV